MKTLATLPGMTVLQSDTIVGTPTLAPMLSCYGELLDKEWAAIGIPFRNTSSVIWIEDQDGQVMGGICYDIVTERREGWINLSFTVPEFRGRGINALAHSHFEQECKLRGMIYIGSIVSTENVQRLRSAEKVGLEPLFYRMIKRL